VNNDRGVFWQAIFFNEDGSSHTLEFNNAEAMRKAAKVSSLPPSRIKLYKMDPVHGSVELMY
jgi:hypothetical protein